MWITANQNKLLSLIIIVALILIAVLFIAARPTSTTNNDFQPLFIVRRDTSRKDTLLKIHLEIVSYFNQNGRYPSVLRFNTDGTTVIIGNTRVNLENESINNPAINTATATSTRYCYSFDSKESIVGVLLETGEWHYRGDLTGECKII